MDSLINVNQHINEKFQERSRLSKAALNKFSEIYKNVGSKINTKGEFSEEAKDILDKLKKLLKVEITDRDYDSKGNLLILQIIKRASSEIKPKDVKYVKESVYKLWKEVAITLRECLDAIEWLSNYYKSEKIKGKCEEYLIDIVNGEKNLTDKEKSFSVI